MGTSPKDQVSRHSQDSRPRLQLVRGDDRKTSVTRATRALRNVPSPSLDDSEVLLALRRGDASAATALHDRSRPVADRAVRRLLGPRDRDHEDLVQQTMIELVMKIDAYRGECSLDAWISTLAAHVVYKQIRKRSAERRVFEGVDLATLQVAAPASGGGEILARNALARVVLHLQSIDEAKAWAYVLHDVWGYDLREVARFTGVSVAAAQTRLVRGRRELEERLAADPELASTLAEIGDRS